MTPASSSARVSIGGGQVAAIDLGATSGRVMVADVGPGRLELTQVARFTNEPVALWNGHRPALHWDLPGLFAAAGAGLAEAARRCDRLVGVGVDSWAVDYGLLRGGRLLGLPHHYRDSRAIDAVATVHSRVDRRELFSRNGLQHLPFTTLFQLDAERTDGLLDVADAALLIPDLINYWLTGVAVTERTNASTTGLLRTDGRWDTELMTRLGLPTGLFPGVVDAGTTLGPLLPGVATSFGIDAAPAVTTVGSHDTASAIAAVPMDPGSSAYVSCGTWGLVGVELDGPRLSDAAAAANFTNEAGVDGTVRFLHNVMGLWLLSETIRQFERDGYRADLAELLAQATDVVPTFDVFNTDDPAFLAPGDMPGRIRGWYAERGLAGPLTRPEIVRAIVESLAVAFAATVHDASRLSGTPVRRIHLVGGGSQNRLLCQLTADRSGLPVHAGPAEATALGNVAVAARAHGLIHGDLSAIRAMVANTFGPQIYLPTTTRRASPSMSAGRVSR
ncbi:rhamnulokinase [Gordonia sp. TBRC 11910]|uniref:Rhamnulokinase n=1 Tax=Gordonia asplenii TaxID=2725283 RepID=A0A848KN15_9ACTN|nr:rhamnulokinase family protein [Gordonia asplenii]NMO00066.1 rhamnulokinase [Gordonia asplenii]